MREHDLVGQVGIVMWLKLLYCRVHGKKKAKNYKSYVVTHCRAPVKPKLVTNQQQLGPKGAVNLMSDSVNIIFSLERHFPLQLHCSACCLLQYCNTKLQSAAKCEAVVLSSKYCNVIASLP